MMNSKKRQDVKVRGKSSGKVYILSLGLAGLGGLSGYLVNWWVAATWGATTLGHLLGLISAFTLVALPASLIPLPVAKWAMRTASWRVPFRRMQVGTLLATTFFGLLVWSCHEWWMGWFHIKNSSWVIPLITWIPTTYLTNLQSGLLQGRRAYQDMVIVGAMPTVGKLILTFGLFEGHLVPGPSSLLWAISISSWLSFIIGVRVIVKSSPVHDTVDLPPSAWSSIWVSVTTSSWLGWDVLLGDIILGPRQLSIFAVAATLGKVPYHLTSVIARMGISESHGNRASVSIRKFILGFSLAFEVLVLFSGPLIFRLFHVTQGYPYPALLGYTAANALLALGYMDNGIAALRDWHTWWPYGLALVGWTFSAWIVGATASALTVDLCVWMLTAYLSSRLLIRRSDTHSAKYLS